uniref:Takusan n=1 Tax=Myoviridae sp. ct04y17 TaxID=2827652 RepID=A0A8S5SID5_9CAUD|nr:MAG TPA: Takusan [Myoviridae sp. ct04y17]
MYCFSTGNYIRLYTYILTFHRPDYCRPFHVPNPFYQG